MCILHNLFSFHIDLFSYIRSLRINLILPGVDNSKPCVYVDAGSKWEKKECTSANEKGYICQYTPGTGSFCDLNFNSHRFISVCRVAWDLEN